MSVVACVPALALVAAGCGSKSSSSSSSSGAAASASTTTSSTPNVGRLPTVKSALHAGLTFGAFHRWIYKLFKAGKFSGSILSNKLTKVKAPLAGLFAYHELKIAIKDAQASPVLSKLKSPVTALADKLKGVGSSIKSGKPDTSSIDSANGDITSLSSLAKQSGISISDQFPSAAQVASGGSS